MATCTTYIPKCSTPGITNPCPSYPNAICVRYTGPNLTNIGVTTNSNLQQILQDINEAFSNVSVTVYIEAGTGIDVTGAGTEHNPYIISSTLDADVPINTLLAATGTNTINNSSYLQTWNWNLTSANAGLALGGSFSGSGTKSLLNITSSGSASGPLNSLYISSTASLQGMTDVLNYIAISMSGSSAGFKHGVGVYSGSATTGTSSAGFFSDVDNTVTNAGYFRKTSSGTAVSITSSASSGTAIGLTLQSVGANASGTNTALTVFAQSGLVNNAIIAGGNSAFRRTGTSSFIPSGIIHIGAGDSTSVPSLIITGASSVMATPVNYSFEPTPSHLYWTDGSGNRYQLDQQTTGLGNNIYNADGTLNSTRAVDMDGYSITWSNAGLYRITYAVGSNNGVYDFNQGVDFLTYDNDYSTTITSDTIDGIHLNVTDLNTTDEVNFDVKSTGIFATLDNNTSQDVLVGAIDSTGALGSVTIGTGLQLAGGVLTTTFAVIYPTLQQIFDVELDTAVFTTDNIIDVDSNSFTIINATIFSAGTTTSSISTTANDATLTGGSSILSINNTNCTWTNLSNVSTQDYIIGLSSSNDYVGYITIGDGLSLVAGELVATAGSGSIITEPFNATSDWGSPSGGYYSFTFTHNLGSEDLNITIWDDTSTSTIVLPEIVETPDGNNITISVPETPDSRFAGRIVVSSASMPGVGGVVADGNYGDITVSGVGTVFTINPTVVSFSKIQDISTSRLLGRTTASSGSVEQLTVGTGLSLGSGSLSLSSTLAGFSTYNTNGVICQTSASTFAGRTITGSSNRISITNGDGVSGNPTIDIAATYVGQTSITTLGTISTGSWSGSTIAVNRGGTGQTSYTNGQLLIGNTTGNTLDKATLTGTSNQITVTNGAGSITLSTPQNIATSSSPQFAGLGVGTSGSSGVLDLGNSATLTGYLGGVDSSASTSYPLVAGDTGRIKTFTSNSPITVTVPSLSVGFNVTIIQLGTGQITLTASGTTINNRSSHTKTAGQYAVVTLACYATNTFALGGDTGT